MGKPLEYIEVYFGNTLDLIEDQLPSIIGTDHAFIAAYYNFYLHKKLTTSNTKKLNLFLTTKSDLDNEYFIDKISNLYLFLELNELKSLKGFDLKLYLSKKINTSLNYFGSKDNWDLNLINIINGSLLESKFEFKDYYGKSVKTKSAEARIYFECNENIDLYIEVKNGNTISRILFSRLKMNSTFIEQFKTMLSKIEWVSENSLRIHHANKKDYWKISINDSKVNFYFDRAEKGAPQGEYDLGMMYLNGRIVLKSEELGNFWIKKSADQGYQKAVKMLKNS